MSEHKQQALSKKILNQIGIFEKGDVPPYKEFLEEWMPPHVLNTFAAHSGGFESPDFVATMQAFYAALVVAKNDDVVFTLTPELIHALRDTEVPDASVDDIRLPFDGINIDFPRGTLEDPAHEVDRLMLCLIPNDRFRVVYHHDEHTNYLNFIPKEGSTLFQCTAEAQEQQWERISDPGLIQQYRDSALYEDYWHTDMFRLAINTMLYITSPDADVVEDKSRIRTLHTKLQGLKKGGKQSVLLDKLAKARKMKRYIVGAKFRLSQEYNAKLTDEGKKWVLQHRVRVMGHWRNQPYGPKSELRRRQWVAPFWKGPTYAEMVEKGYVVK